MWLEVFRHTKDWLTKEERLLFYKFLKAQVKACALMCYEAKKGSDNHLRLPQK